MGRDGFDNLQTVNLGEMSPLPQPKNRPGGGYHPAGAGIHDFMGTCTIGKLFYPRGTLVFLNWLTLKTGL